MENQNKDPKKTMTFPAAMVHTARFETVQKPPEVDPFSKKRKDIVIGDESRDKKGRKKKSRHTFYVVRAIWRKVSPFIAAILSIVIVYFALRFAVGFAVKKYVKPVDANDATPIVVEIPKGSGASAIAKILYEAGGEGEKGLIQNKAIFKVYVDFKGKSSSLKAGTYILSRNMSISRIVDIICTGNPPRRTAKFTVSEGMTVEAIASKLVDLDILRSPERFLELARTGEAFAGKYWFIKDIVDKGRPGRLYMLEGYLFPDTYEVYADATEEEIITKMLDRFNEVYERRYVERAEELNLSLDDVVVLASIIEKEAKTFDFTKVSAVFHGRLQRNMMLNSDATLDYVLKSGKLEFTQEELSTDSPYNTYRVYGLPAGPISNPGRAAIEAVLYPFEQYMDEGYLYFCLMDSTTGALVFAKTLEEHEENVARYKPYWS
ncbi:MAG: endolytic transglycosylase MltG [Clostridiales bacterium]|nr:endolytic transglycosylase MltG [Clostridiales bacterium]